MWLAMSFQNYWLFLPACFAINMALGPNNVLSISNGARNGVRCAVLVAFGRLLAFAVMIAIAGLGLGALLLASGTLFTALKFGGAAYLSLWPDAARTSIRRVWGRPRVVQLAPANETGIHRGRRKSKGDSGFHRVFPAVCRPIRICNQFHRAWCDVSRA
jgi:hypothetical protein